MSRERTTRRRIWIWAGAVAGFVALVLVMGLSLPYTETGSRWLLGWVGGRLPEGLRYQAFSGTLAGPFELQGLEYDFGRIRGRIERVVVQWQVWQLLAGRVQLDSVRVTGALVTWDSTFTPPAAEATPPEESGDTQEWQVHWDHLALSGGVVEGPRDVTLHDIEITSSGALDSFRVWLGSRVTWDTISGVALTLAGHGDLNHLEFEELTLSRDSTRMAAHGRVNWQPEPAWDVQAEVDGLDPASWSEHLSRLHGSLRLVGRSQGNVAADVPDLSLVVDTLSGLLEGTPIRGHASLRIRDHEVHADSTWIDWLGLSASVQGTYADSVNLTWKAKVPDLSLFVSDGTGNLWAEGEAHGPREALEVNAAFGGGRLAFRDYRADSIAGQVAWKRGGALPSALTARLQRVVLSGWELDSAALEARGTRALHTLRVDAAGPHRVWHAVFNGSYDSLWHTRVDSLAIGTQRSGVWRLAAPAEILAGPGQASVSPLCLEGDNGRLCVEGEVHSGDDWQVAAELDSLSTDWLSLLVFEDAVVDSRLSGRVQLNSTDGGLLSAAAQLALGPGTLTLAAFPEDTLVAESLAVALNWTPEAGRLEASGGFALKGEHTPFELTALLPGTGRVRTELARDSVQWQALPWSGTLEVSPLSLGWLDPLLPEGAHLDGEATLHVAAASGQDGRILGDCVVELPPGQMQVWTGTDTLMLDWSASAFSVHADSAGMVAQAHSQLSMGSRAVGTLAVDVRSTSLLSMGQPPLDLPLEGTIKAEIELAPLAPFMSNVTGLQGRFQVNTALRGTPRDLALEGSLELSAEAFLLDLGIQLSQVRLSMQAEGGNATVSGSARSGQGTLELSGTMSRLPSRELPSRLRVHGQDFQLLDSRQASVWISPDLELVMFGDSLDLSGTITVPRARIEIVELPEQAVAASPDEVIEGDTLASAGPRSPFWSKVQVILGDQVFFKGFDVTAFLGGSLEVRHKPLAEPEARGEVVLREGRYRGMGQDLMIDPGRLIFSGPLFNPTIDVLAYRRATDHTKAGFKVSGRLAAPQVDLYSDPMKTDDDIMSYILFGRSAGAGSESERMKASEAAAYLGGNLLAAQAATQIGLDEARIDPGYTGNDATLVAGKYISPQLFVGYGTGLFESLHTLRVRYIVSTHISLQAETGTRETADVIYQIERGD